MSLIQIKRRLAGGASGAPSSLKSGELAWNGTDETLYYGEGDDGEGVATSIIELAGAGAFVRHVDAREVLTAARTYYVRKDGSDSNTGLADNAASAFLTITHAVNAVLGLDCRTHNVAIQVGAGTYAETVNITAPILGSGSFTIVGDRAAPSAVKVTSIRPNNKCSVILLGMEITGNNGLLVRNNATAMIDDMLFSGGTAMNIQSGGAVDATNAAIEVASTVTSIVNVTTQGRFLGFGVGITLNANAWSGASAFYMLGQGQTLLHNATFTGTATGKRYSADGLSFINTNNGGANFIPGSVAGTAINGSVYK